ncbi:MAG: HAD-IIIA family hydrolase [Verrucomicrobiota bacterium]|nr:HAD-IIIA family hydrolase [Verrucomicrobiota bacterium]
MELLEKTKKITTVILDVDGVLTDGSIGYCGSEEIKFFNAADGYAIKVAMRTGLQIGILSGRKSKANETRFAELGIEMICQGEKIKLDALKKMSEQYNFTYDQCLYVGDDIVDIPVMNNVLIGATVADAAEQVLQRAGYIAKKSGGKGAVREILEWLMKAKGTWSKQMQRYGI